MKKILLSTSLCLFIISANAQYAFETYNTGTDTIKVIENGKTLQTPFSGGIDVPQFSSIDLNMDGVKDIVVFDREGYRLSTFLNIGGTNEMKYEFVPQYIKAFPILSDWCLLVDYNGDGKEDIFTSIPGGLKVYKNISTSNELKFELTFKEINSDYGNFITRLYVQNTDIPAIIDVDEDGDVDVLTFAQSIDSSGESIYWFKNMSKERFNTADSMQFIVGKYCWGKFRESFTNCHINLQYPIGICGSSGKNIPNITKEELDLRMSAKSADGKHSGSTTTIFDANGDGKYDMLIGDVSCNNLYLLTNGSDNVSPIMTQAYYEYPPTHPINIEIFPSSYILDINNDGLKDLVSSINMTNAAENTNHVEAYLNNGANSINRYDFSTDNFLLSEMIEVAEGAAPCFVDYNVDGLMDIVISNSGYYQGNGVYKTGLAVYKNIGTTTLAKYELVSRDWFGFSSLNIANMAPSFGDMDNDGDLDMVCGSSDGTLNYFQNNASGQTTMSLSFIPNYFAGIDVGNFSSPFIYDFENDGKPEVIVAERNANINLFSNTGSLTNPVYTLTTDSLYKINLADYLIYPNGRGRLTIQTLRQNEAPRVVVSNANSRIYILGEVNNNYTTANNTRVDSIDLRAGTFSNSNGGFYFSFADLNNDHKPELVAGTPQGGLFMYKNVSTTVGITNSIKKFDLSIYPNPATEFIYLKSISNEVFKSLKLFNIKGELIFESNEENSFQKIDIKNIASGMYIIKAQSKDAICVEKIMITK